MAAPNKPSVIVTLAQVDRQQGTYVLIVKWKIGSVFQNVTDPDET